MLLIPKLISGHDLNHISTDGLKQKLSCLH